MRLDSHRGRQQLSNSLLGLLRSISQKTLDPLLPVDNQPLLLPLHVEELTSLADFLQLLLPLFRQPPFDGELGLDFELVVSRIQRDVLERVSWVLSRFYVLALHLDDQALLEL
jgi:hypothetical protein